MFQALIEKLTRHEDLTADEASAAMAEVMEGRAAPAHIAGLLVGLAMKGERPVEIVGLGERIRQLASHAADAGNFHVVIPKISIDVVDTLLDNHVQNSRCMAMLPQVRRQMDVVQRNVLDVSIKWGHRPNESNLHTGQILTEENSHKGHEGHKEREHKEK